MKLNTFGLLAVAGYTFCLLQLAYVWCWTTNEQAIGGLFPMLFVAASPWVGWALARLQDEHLED